MTTRSLPIRGQPRPANETPSVAFLAKGFRPFFLLATLHALLFVPLWVLTTRGWLGAELSVSWHAQEMLHGFTLAVIAGFLLTAVGNWTERETATGPLLGLLACAWVAGRVGGFLEPGVLRLGLRLAFLPLLMLTLARPLIATRNVRNYPFLPLLGLLLATAVVAETTPELASLSVRFGLDIVLVVVVLMTGRILPMFTRNATGADAKGYPLADRIATFSVLLVAFLSLVPSLAPMTAGFAFLAAVAVAARAWRWKGWSSRRQPLLWVLHVGHGWLVVGLVLRAFEPAGVPASSALHALTVGVIGTLCLGMMVRVTLGHTGRQLQPSRLASIAFVLITAAAVVRVATGLVGSRSLGWALSGALWTGAFTLTLLTLTPMLFAARVDGRPG